MRTYDIAQDRDRFVYASSALHAVVIISRHRMEAQEETFVLSLPSSPEHPFALLQTLACIFAAKMTEILRDDHPRVQAAFLQSRDLGARRADFGL